MRLAEVQAAAREGMYFTEWMHMLLMVHNMAFNVANIAGSEWT